MMFLREERSLWRFLVVFVSDLAFDRHTPAFELPMDVYPAVEMNYAITTE